MIACLDSVRLAIITPALTRILVALGQADFDVLITSGTDGEHHHVGAHARGEAVDIRVIDLPTLAARRVRQQHLATALGPLFTVLLEPDDIPGDTAAPHIHIQLKIGATYPPPPPPAAPVSA